MIKYRYALDENNNLVDVNLLERSNLSKSTKFYSVDFKLELIAKLGQIKVKHFAHKANYEVVGTQETYLHALGKRIFKEEYLCSLRSGQPFNITYWIQRTCTRLKLKYGIDCELPPKESSFNLSKYFTEIIEETKDGSFIPDLMILNPSTGEKIYIEIAVSHLSSTAKLHSGNRIIEIILKSEEDVNSIKDFRNGIMRGNIHFHNFKIKKEEGSLCKEGHCISSFYFFSISKNGKCKLDTITEEQIEPNKSHYNKVGSWYLIEGITGYDIEQAEHFQADFFAEYVARGQRLTGKVKNCYICRYHADNTSFDLSFGEPIFCKFLKLTCGSNQAAECQYYRVEKKYVYHEDQTSD